MGGRSRAAVQLLSGMGFKEPINLTGGIKAWNGEKAKGPAEFHLSFLEEGDSIDRILRMAYHMEAALGRFYKKILDSSEDKELKKLVGQLADAERRHCERVVGIGVESGMPADAFEPSTKHTNVIEGGIDVEEFMEKNKAFLGSRKGILEVAMAIETQALDLYLRLAHTVDDESSKQALYKISDEEKGHLTMLAKLLDDSI